MAVNRFSAQRSAGMISVSALALLIGLGAALAEAGGDARNTDRQLEKERDARDLSPIKPIRHVGPEWPPSQQQSQEQSASEKKDIKGNTQTTTGQTSKEDAAKPEPQKSAPAPAAQNQTPTVTPQTVSPQPVAAQNAPASNAIQNSQASPDKDSNKTQSANNNTASIRLGTDANGKVAVNTDQERQLRSALRRARPIDLNVSVKVGDAVPANVRIGAVSADFVDVLPQFRGYSYFATREEIYIVDPGQNRIVALLPIKLSATASAPAQKSTAQTAARPRERNDRNAQSPARSNRMPSVTLKDIERSTTGSGRVEEIVIEPNGTTTTYIRAPRVYRSAPPMSRSRIYQFDDD